MIEGGQFQAPEQWKTVPRKAANIDKVSGLGLTSVHMQNNHKTLSGRSQGGVCVCAFCIRMCAYVHVCVMTTS